MVTILWTKLSIPTIALRFCGQGRFHEHYLLDLRRAKNWAQRCVIRQENIWFVNQDSLVLIPRSGEVARKGYNIWGRVGTSTLVLAVTQR
jgi:hypothetical protein